MLGHAKAFKNDWQVFRRRKQSGHPWSFVIRCTQGKFSHNLLTALLHSPSNFHPLKSSLVLSQRAVGQSPLGNRMYRNSLGRPNLSDVKDGAWDFRTVTQKVSIKMTQSKTYGESTLLVLLSERVILTVSLFCAPIAFYRCQWKGLIGLFLQWTCCLRLWGSCPVLAWQHWSHAVIHQAKVSSTSVPFGAD